MILVLRYCHRSFKNIPPFGKALHPVYEHARHLNAGFYWTIGDCFGCPIPNLAEMNLDLVEDELQSWISPKLIKKPRNTIWFQNFSDVNAQCKSSGLVTVK